MQQRGRKSAAQMESAGAVMVIDRPDVPLDLTPEEADEWRAVVDGMPADWFPRETWPLLAQFCRHTVSARRVAQMVDSEMARDPIDVDTIGKLLQMQARETSALKAMAAAMRLAQQSSRSHDTATTSKRKRTVKRLWDG